MRPGATHGTGATARPAGRSVRAPLAVSARGDERRRRERRERPPALREGRREPLWRDRHGAMKGAPRGVNDHPLRGKVGARPLRCRPARSDERRRRRARERKKKISALRGGALLPFSAQCPRVDLSRPPRNARGLIFPARRATPPAGGPALFRVRRAPHFPQCVVRPRGGRRFCASERPSYSYGQRKFFPQTHILSAGVKFSSKPARSEQEFTRKLLKFGHKCCIIERQKVF